MSEKNKKEPSYQMTEIQLKALLERAFEQGWRLRMNRKAGECQAIMENVITLIFLDIDGHSPGFKTWKPGDKGYQHS